MLSLQTKTNSMKDVQRSLTMNFCGNLQTGWVEILVQWTGQNWTQSLTSLIFSPLVELCLFFKTLMTYWIHHFKSCPHHTYLLCRKYLCFSGVPRVPTETPGEIVNHGQSKSCLGSKGLVSTSAANSTQGWYIILTTSAKTQDRQAFQHFWLGDLALNTHTDASTWSPGCLYCCPSVGVALRQITR